LDGTVSSSEALRPTAVETVLYEPDQQSVIAVLSGALWLSPGDVVELDEPPRDARVLSTRLQLRDGGARVLVVLDVPDDPEQALRGDTPTEVVLGADAGKSSLVGNALDEELEQLTEDNDLDAAPDKGASS
jgi:hypothetical protein